MKKETEMKMNHLKREYYRLDATPQLKAKLQKEAKKLGYRLVPSMFGCHLEEIKPPVQVDKVISVMESEWKRLKEIEKMYFEMLKEVEGK
ncbi:hypothetical protein H3010_gp07 [Bacillus phage BeachBum]|uniref:Uncharacterized protein n=1 Tax=Bacillus phage BeachBum TaxID=1983461 RepID=A0A1X9SGG7_9CAUD|nr:hypothetical protein H3010_gp07 [Bacillus phage BeachBum]ARQ95232.1 hypothetical protein BEACHBUM_7 [Bacillus phage BeachBum]